MLKFRDIKINDLTKIKNIISKNNVISSLYSTYNLYALRKKYDTKIAFNKNTLYIQQLSRNEPPYNSYLFPIGEEPITQTIEGLQKHAGATNRQIMLWGLTNEMVTELERVLPNFFMYQNIPNWSDYVYEKDKVILGKMMRKARNFQKNYQHQYVIEEISENNIKEIIDFQNKWMLYNVDHNDDISSLNFEHQSIIESLSMWNYLPLKGFCIKINNIIVGFSYGFLQTPDCFMIHVIKTDKSIKGLTVFLFKYIVEFINVNYINFEEDIGIEGLRIFKTRLEPSFMLDKYQAFPNKN